MLLISQFPAFF